ncbi:MAG: phage portal protein [Alphaproteobacteria bacterium GWC2_42_16]|nr:MAG: phage portal protein [Alphaproteobacteria bacterium GWC2_42_16]OFW73032.1 MAG: phage portal protein [Alphaproteobacteria bacterium GWA2_41_27]OFW81490.1 MAG: phage portal protein [Alphaproteobacteria bacterium RIFCSPHIGHO2_12_FULL_42_100]OFW85251.1 MAG: phage portal protein [Alphaproteobacteria bacterium RBG_16_42_14]OFW93257.1 MAG: phage portal protein [Alphaproteobacteria bacterium RIFCSPHIGHO2_02_FULL_42_30]OFX03992.1 MAG: phage portal protein [Alphaproteobacteria bacterium RIFCSPLO
MKSWFRNLFRIHETKASTTSPLFATSFTRQPLWTPRQYDTLAEEGYQKNIIVYRCVTLIARGVAGVPWRLYKGDTCLEEHPLLTLLQNPNPQQSLPCFMEALTSYLLLAGNVYVEAIAPEKEPLELYLLRPDRIRIMPGKSGVPEGYQYTLGGRSIIIPVDPLQGRSSLLHIKSFNPLNDWYGMSPIEAAAHAIDQHNAVAGHNLALLQNGGRPTGALQLRSTGDLLTDEQRQELRHEIQNVLEGTRNSGRILILEGNFEWQEMGLSPKDLDFIEGKYLSAREIAQVYGVPPMLVGVPGDATFSNYKEARYHLWEDTILPYLEIIKGELNQWLTPFFGDDLNLTYDVESIPALAPKRDVLWEKIEKASFLTINEKRALIGYPPIPDGDRRN